MIVRYEVELAHDERSKSGLFDDLFSVFGVFADGRRKLLGGRHDVIRNVKMWGAPNDTRLLYGEIEEVHHFTAWNGHSHDFAKVHIPVVFEINARIMHVAHAGSPFSTDRLELAELKRKRGW